VTTWCWLAVVDDMPAAADAAGVLRTPDGAAAGVLAAWLRRAKPVRHALRADRRIVDPGGAAATISLVLPPAGWRLKFDDGAVQQARRDVLARRPADAVSTLLFDASHFAGAITVERSDPARLADDPFARIFPARILEVGDGGHGAVAAPSGPGIERHGSANPWPWPSFSSS
jgi:hypothetical protein